MRGADAGIQDVDIGSGSRDVDVGVCGGAVKFSVRDSG